MELANMIMETEKSHHLLPASWRPRKDSCSQSEDLRFRRMGDITSSQNLEAWKQRPLMV